MGISAWQVISTPWILNMEPKNGPLEKDSPFLEIMHFFLLPCSIAVPFIGIDCKISGARLVWKYFIPDSLVPRRNIEGLSTKAFIAGSRTVNSRTTVVGWTLIPLISPAKEREPPELSALLRWRGWVWDSDDTHVWYLQIYLDIYCSMEEREK